MKNVSQLTNFVQNKLNEYTQTTTRTADVGIVLQVGDGIARIYGLENVASGENPTQYPGIPFDVLVQ